MQTSEEHTEPSFKILGLENVRLYKNNVADLLKLGKAVEFISILFSEIFI
jgi:hypothetical protein